VIHELIGTLAPGPWSLGGHSNGGLLAVVAATDGSPVVRLVTIDIPSNPVTPQLLRSGRSFRRIPQPQWTSRDEAMNAFRLFPRDGDAPPDVLRHVGWHSVRESADGTWTSKFDWRYFRSRNAESPNPYLDFDARLARIPCPTLVVRGERSSIQTADEHAILMSRIPQPHAVVIAGAGHNPHLERPADTADAIARFSTERFPTTCQSSGTAGRFRRFSSTSAVLGRASRWHGRCSHSSRWPSRSSHPRVCAEPPRATIVALAAVILVALALVYAPVRHAGFFYFDDDFYVTENPFVRHGLTLAGSRKPSSAAAAHCGCRSPSQSHMVDASLFGLTPDGPHVVNVLLHAGTTLSCSRFSSGRRVPSRRASRSPRCSRCIRCGWSRWRGSPSGRTSCRRFFGLVTLHAWVSLHARAEPAPLPTRHARDGPGAPVEAHARDAAALAPLRRRLAARAIGHARGRRPPAHAA
jgi:thioesterase domain-containing protein